MVWSTNSSGIRSYVISLLDPLRCERGETKDGDAKLTFIEDLGADDDALESGVLRNGHLLFLVVGRRHPEGQAAAVDEGFGGKVEDVVEEGGEAVGLLGGHVVGRSAAVSRQTSGRETHFRESPTSICRF